jgi:4-carboxymuconolactone decarboxylase
MKTSMQFGLTALLVVGLCAAAYRAGRASALPAQAAVQWATPQAISSYPSDIDPESRNRLPLVEREDLDDLGKSLFDKTMADVKSGRSLAGFQGPNGITLHSPRVAESDQRKNDYLRFESPLGRRFYEVAILATARELNHQFEWAAHEPAALAAGVEPAVIDIIKFRRPLVGLQPKDAALIQLGREVIGRQVVEATTLAEALALFGRQDLVDAVSVMGHYAGIAILLNAFNQQLSIGQQPLLPLP